MDKRVNTAATGSAADKLADHLRQAILEGKFEIGDSLPSERELMSRFGVSRSTVREALRMLDAQGLIEVRRGRTGGSYISDPPPELVVQSLDLFIRGQSIRLADLLYAREAIECAAASQAAACRSEEGLERLRLASEACAETIGDAPAFVQANVDWHIALVEASGNPLFIAFMKSIAPAVHTATDFDEFDLRIRKIVVGVHWQIFLAIRDGDAEAAGRRMMRHLSAYGDVMKKIEADEAGA